MRNTIQLYKQNSVPAYFRSTVICMPTLLMMGLQMTTSAVLAQTTARQRSHIPNHSGYSVYAAAKLKALRAGWLAHYLPDDRYKIAGGVWKYVSTEEDAYFHRADSPEMLNQYPDRVIGFASRKDAEEAGYVAGPSVSRDDLSVSSYSDSIEGSELGAVPIREIRNATRNAKRIVLADGRTTVVLPPGWMAANTRLLEGTNGITASYVRPINSKEQTGFAIQIVHDAAGFGNIGTAAFRRGVQQEFLSGKMDKVLGPAGAAKMKKSESILKITDLTVGGRAGYSMQNVDGSPLKGNSKSNDLLSLLKSPTKLRKMLNTVDSTRLIAVNVGWNANHAATEKVIQSLAFN